MNFAVIFQGGELLHASGRIAADEEVCVVTLEQYPSSVARLPLSGREIAYRAVSQLQQGKFAEPLAIPSGVHRLRLRRPPLPNDGISGEFDFSIERIEALIAQGREAAADALREVAVGAVPA